MTRHVTIAAVQLPATSSGANNLARQTHNFDTAGQWLTQAGESGADIACLGETFNIMGLKLTPESTAATVGDARARAVKHFAPIARRFGMAIIAPVMTGVDGQVRNIALVLDRGGEYIGHYTKVHCIENEKALGVIPGDDWPVFDLDFGRIGIQICHDNSFPESARCLTMNGAEVIFWPHVMGGWGGEFMDILLRSPAIHNGIYHVPVCFGCPPDRAWQPGMLIGRSSIIGPDAMITADAGRYPGIALARIDLDAPRVATSFTRDGDYVWQVDMFNDRRPETYEPLVRPVTKQPPISAADMARRAAESGREQDTE
jgi:predicted amidohydrolase